MEHTKEQWTTATGDPRFICDAQERDVAVALREEFTIEEANANAKRICKCVNSHDALVKACEVAVLALTHKPINPDDIEFIEAAIAKAENKA